MPLESATYIDDLNISNPAASDNMSQADDHLRMLKSVLKNTFPNLTAPMTKTEEALNNGVVPVGGIIMWSGAADAIPTGWKLCDGGTYAKMDGSGNITVPDLNDKFIMGCGGTNAAPLTAPTIGTTGGQTSVTPTITVTNEAVALTEAQMPSHTHTATVTEVAHTHTASQAAHTHTVTGAAYTGAGGYGSGVVSTNSTNTTSSAQPAVTVDSAVTGISVSNASKGSGATHIHNNTATSSAVSTLPPYYVLAFICRI